MAKFKFFESAKIASSQAEAEAARKREEESAKAVEKIEAEERRKLELALKSKYDIVEVEKGKLRKALDYERHPVVAELQDFANARVYNSLTDEAREALKDKAKKITFDNMINDIVTKHVKSELSAGKTLDQIDEKEMMKHVVLDISLRGKEPSQTACKDHQLQKFPFESERGPFFGPRNSGDADPKDAKRFIGQPKNVRREEREEPTELHHVKAPDKKDKKDKK